MLDLALDCNDQVVFVPLKLPHHVLDLAVALTGLVLGVFGCHVEEVDDVGGGLVLLPLVEVGVDDLLLELVLLVEHHVVGLPLQDIDDLDRFERLLPTPETRAAHQVVAEPL